MACHTKNEKFLVVSGKGLVNEGSADLVTLIWCNECFDPKRPDTIYEKVEKQQEK